MSAIHSHRSIRSGFWFLAASQVESYLPLAVKIIKGESNMPRGDRDPLRFFSLKNGAVTEHNEILLPESSRESTPQSASNSGKEDLIAIYTIHGVMTKHDQWCGPSGMLTLMDDMAAMDNDSRVIAHVIDFDTPGGEASICDTFARSVRSLKKPVLSYFNSMTCSAGYYVAAASTEIYASEGTDIVGSIGTMLSFADFTEYFEKQGIKIHEIYADQSTEKNADFREAREGKYKSVKEGFLNPYAQAFIDAVKEFRPQIEDESAFKGKVYTAVDAIKIGMIDGIKPFSEVIRRATDLGKAHERGTSKSKIENSMKFTTILAVLGIASLEFKDGYASLSEDDISKINDALPELEVNAKEESPAPAPKAENEANTQITALSEQIKALSDVISKQQAAIEAFSSQPAEPKGNAASDADLPDNLSDEARTAKQSLDAYNKKMAAMAEKGEYADFSYS